MDVGGGRIIVSSHLGQSLYSVQCVFDMDATCTVKCATLLVKRKTQDAAMDALSRADDPLFSPGVANIICNVQCTIVHL